MALDAASRRPIPITHVRAAAASPTSHHPRAASADGVLPLVLGGEAVELHRDARAVLAARAHAVRRRRASRQGRGVSRRRRSAAARRHGHRPRAAVGADRRAPAPRRSSCWAISCTRASGRVDGARRARFARGARGIADVDDRARARQPRRARRRSAAALATSTCVAEPHAFAAVPRLPPSGAPPSAATRCAATSIRACGSAAPREPSERLPCFVLGRAPRDPAGVRRLHRPCAGRRPSPATRVVAIAGSALFALPPPTALTSARDSAPACACRESANSLRCSVSNQCRYRRNVGQIGAVDNPVDGAVEKRVRNASAERCFS